MTEITEQTRLPLIGDPAPAFEAESTHGVISLDSYKGKWIMLFSHPADFTPVCTTEFIAFAENIAEFEKRNVQLIGNSVDSIFSHLGWIQSIQQNAGVQITFPIIADLEMKVAKAYGMIHPESNGTNAVRAVFLIDDRGTVRAMVYYPLNAGRNVDELLRLVDALQTSDREGVSCPANWTPGDDVVIGAPRTTEALRERLADDTVDLTDWYLAKKSLEV
jgi:peroxiredoxin (alkyl hydroperoxide reductase subunit C)